MKDEQEWGEECERGRFQRPYWDPALASGGAGYEDFIESLYGAGLLDWCEKAQVVVGAFVAWKKSGKQRLVIDARPASRRFRTPPPVRLGGPEEWAALRGPRKRRSAPEGAAAAVTAVGGNKNTTAGPVAAAPNRSEPEAERDTHDTL